MTEERRRRIRSLTDEAAEPEAPENASPADAGSPGVDVDTCLDSFASMLRHWGRGTFDLPSTTGADASNQFEAWARHLLLGTPPPGAEDETSQVRDWIELDRFVRQHRSEEREHVISSLQDLRQTLWVFVESFSKAVSADRSSDARVKSQLTNLREAVKADDTSQLRQQASAAANLIEGVIEVRAARYENQIERLSSRLDQLATQLIESREKGAIDALTGVYNRASFDEHLTRVTQLGAVLGSCAIVFMIDVDHFKWVNDKYGHQVGDEILRKVARGLKRCLRRRDDFVGRYGGDEFVAIIRGRTQKEALEEGERLLFAIKEIEVPHEGETVRVSASIGAAVLISGETTKEWLGRADKAMYEAKQGGRERVSVADGDSE
ncbi:MAG: GGDEF domain-containing protein [Myxococcota bacterium]